jgi:hypothetical protein
MPYREEQDALQERLDNLQRELDALRAQTRDLGELKARETELSADAEKVRAQLERMRGRRALPLLDQVRVASPCNASWDDMTGDDRVRFCGKCEKNVFNISAMPREDAEQLLRERVGGELCVRFYQRTDGTVLTEDCPVGVRKKRRRQIAFAVAGAGAMAAAGAQLFASGSKCHSATMGEVAPIEAPMIQGSFSVPTAEPPPVVEAPPQEGKAIMGDWAGPPPAAKAKAKDSSKSVAPKKVAPER